MLLGSRVLVCPTYLGGTIRDHLSDAVIGRSARSEFDLLTGTAAWRCCGIAGETSEVIQTHANRATKAFIYRVAPAEELILFGSPGATYFYL